jgi:hypothetical protein
MSAKTVAHYRTSNSPDSTDNVGRATEKTNKVTSICVLGDENIWAKHDTLVLFTKSLTSVRNEFV